MPESMEIMVFGAGYVGLVTGAGLASTGNHVVVVDTQPERIRRLRAGELPFFEPQLPELIARVTRKGTLEFAWTEEERFGERLDRAEVYFIAVGTPEGADGATDLQYVDSVTDTLAAARGDLADRYVVVKSTVPVGTGDRVEEMLGKHGKYPRVVSNPEFLKQGNAVQDFLKPERVVIGASDPAAVETLLFLYRPFMLKRERIVCMGRRSAELVKYACNAFLAAKISFVNEMALLAEAVGADIREIREGMIADSRIGDQFLFPGIGFGGSCFPKDVHSLVHQGAAAGVELKLSEATRRVNQRQKTWPLRKLGQALGDLSGKTICLWGLAFKPNTDDVREAPSVTLIEEIARAGGRVRAYDPVAAAPIRARLGALIADGTLTLLEDAYRAAEGGDALVVVTEWQEFRTPNFRRLRTALRNPLIVDGRNIYDPSFVKRYGFVYYGVGLGVPV